jgi:hypothetical protein
MDSADSPIGEQRRVRVATARDVTTAEGWCDALEAAGIDAFVEIDDDRNVPGGSSPVITTYIGPRFVYPVNVPAEDRDRAAAVLIDHGWNGRFGSRHVAPMSYGTMLRGALVVVAISAAIMLILVGLQ